mmetsp:Transcript_118809/g.383649  ORF Transcript_118809/g.383649 Transcript_118809/m.383649 type:complete len:604 (-) Transcript_118809:134-1945(-)
MRAGPGGNISAGGGNWGAGINGGQLAAAAKPVDSVVGDAPAAPVKAKQKLTSVAFWGICDIKYDPRLSNPRERVALLELGDGRSSRFSHHGRAIKEKFDAEFCMDETPIKRAVMTENKKFTHDMFVMEGFAHLRPPTVAYPRRYHAMLAGQILSDLGVRGGKGAVVLKLCNRSRGAGIVVATPQELDGVLRRLLTPPLGDERWLDGCLKGALNPEFSECMEEACLHWWSNECPLFVVERCCYSIPVAMEECPDTKFDGTMRVAFALYRNEKNQYQKMISVKPFEIAWLGGYWKLPKAAFEENGSGSLEGLHNRVVSSFNSAEKRTAEVSPEHLQEVFDALTPALPSVFQSGGIGVQMIMNVYREDALFRAFALSRVAAAMRATEMPKARSLFDLARRMVKAPEKQDAESLPEMSVMSYIERNAGVCHCLEGNWEKAMERWRLSLKHHTLNSTAYYVAGCYHQEVGEYHTAADCMLKSIALDPDFKSPYCGLGNAYMLQGSFDAAVEAGLACCRRHPDAPVAHHIIGQSVYHSFRRDPSRAWREDAAEVADRAAKALELARRRVPEQWTEADEAMLSYLLAPPQERDRMPEQAVHVWKVYGWRP